MNVSDVEIIIEPWKKLIIHEIIEYNFDDWATQIAFSSKTAGGVIPTINWVNGIVFQSFNFPDTNSVIDEKMKGVLHWSSVMFAVKEKFEKQIIKDNATINLVDVSVNQIFQELAEKLKAHSKYQKKH
ncbi:conserved hypothetical protein [Candidatus Nitrosotenuis uzonensis]|uniref:Uncharacterized protein n=1 Tax=Candidatus Nitrosotenuis uzonensis TaxID=1407055 RepID=V6AST0_9ARCH|nr:conserved hypothetical protein [Candidatus Nitrosotenuis uzonensis]